MPGNRKGGERAAKKNKELYGNDFYARIGAIGGAKSKNGGFAANRELARIAGRKGGLASRKNKAATAQSQQMPTQSDLDLAA